MRFGKKSQAGFLGLILLQDCGCQLFGGLTVHVAHRRHHEKTQPDCNSNWISRQAKHQRAIRQPRKQNRLAWPDGDAVKQDVSPQLLQCGGHKIHASCRYAPGGQDDVGLILQFLHQADEFVGRITAAINTCVIRTDRCNSGFQVRAVGVMNLARLQCGVRIGQLIAGRNGGHPRRLANFNIADSGRCQTHDLVRLDQLPGDQQCIAAGKILAGAAQVSAGYNVLPQLNADWHALRIALHFDLFDGYDTVVTGRHGCASHNFPGAAGIARNAAGRLTRGDHANHS